ncbi:mRNA capping enzyme, catalytic domain-containing protein [Elsinoe ampelina]|uniref:mRNA-capping enzyme subunit alpha n=1 Tax=Elsinoe ampelina TaxID=302913 RepID=A0A6A6G018_9PEZI|nr:mRNA capping enzyme, catalytic domain-containing protein [Elsinoe ampelina]
MSGLLQLSDVGKLAPNDDTLQIFRDKLTDAVGSNKRGFPGAQPVSFARRHLQELKDADYFVCEKTDGIRCLLFLSFHVTADGNTEMAFLVDRKNDFYFIDNPSFHFPLPNQAPDTFHTDTVIDGELVLDTYPDGRTVRRYLVFDCLALDGKPITNRTLDKRLGIFDANVFKPQQALLNKYPEEKEQQPFEVRMKKLDRAYGVEGIFKEMPLLTHGNDGIVFTCRTTPYKSGTDENILKWKPPHENTIDFKLQIGAFPRLGGDTNGHTFTNGTPTADDFDYDACPSFNLLVGEGRGRHSVFGTLFVSDDEWTSMKSLNQMLDARIIECYKDSQGRWRFKREKDGTPRFRDDKDDANHVSTVHSVLESIEDAVSEQDLIAHAAEIRARWKQREAEAARQAREQQQQQQRPA